MISVLYEDESLLFCVKELGISSQSTPRADGLPDLLAAQRGAPVYCVHRLDTAVGGVMVYARTQKMAATLSAALPTDAVQKTYYAVVAGRPAPTDTLRDLLFHDKQKNRTYVVDRPRKGVKEAVLDYETVAYHAESDHSLLKIRLHTGRTHQIRAQLSVRRHPLWGDGKYGSRQKGQIALWSTALTLDLPSRKQTVTCPPPPLAPWTLFDFEKEEGSL